MKLRRGAQLDETKRRLETAVSFAAEVRDVCAAKDEAIAAKEAELAEARAALAAAAARTLAGMSLEAPLKIVDYRGRGLRVKRRRRRTRATRIRRR